MGKAVTWTVRLEATDAEGRVVETSEIVSISRDLKKPTGADFGLKLSEGKAVLERLQTRITQRQVNDASARSRCCVACGSRRPIHDYQTRTTQTLFGKTVVRLPRFRRCKCQSGRPNFSIRCALDHLLPGRTTPELDNVLAELGARHSFREAARILSLFLPASGTSNHTAVRSRLGSVADQIEVRGSKAPYRMSRATKGPVSVFIDGTYVRAVPGFQTRHFEVVMGRLEASGRRPSHFATMPNAKTARHQTISACLRTQGWLPGREIVVFSDGDPSLADAVRHAANSDALHILDWFHVSMRVQHLRQCCRSLVKADEAGQFEFQFAARDLDQMRAKLWCGKVTTARWLLCAAAGELRRVDRKRHSRRVNAKINRLAQMIIEFDRYLEINQSSMPNYAKRSLQGLPVSSSRAESSANALVNRRMNKRRQMRWSPQGAQRVLLTRVAVLDGRLQDGRFSLAA
jgi:hypothetical protein